MEETRSLFEALRAVAEAAEDLVTAWGNWESGNPEIVKREDALIDALENLKEAQRDCAITGAARSYD